MKIDRQVQPVKSLGVLENVYVSDKNSALPNISKFIGVPVSRDTNDLRHVIDCFCSPCMAQPDSQVLGTILEIDGSQTSAIICQPKPRHCRICVRCINTDPVDD